MFYLEEEINVLKGLSNSVLLLLRGKPFLNSLLTQISWNITGSQNRWLFPSYITGSLNKNYQVPSHTSSSLWEKKRWSLWKLTPFSGEGLPQTYFFGQSRWVAISKVILESVQIFQLEWVTPPLLPRTEGKGLYMSKWRIFQSMKQKDENILKICAVIKKKPVVNILCYY